MSNPLVNCMQDRYVLSIVVALSFSIFGVVKDVYAADWYVSSTGSSTNLGTLASPWDIASALTNTARFRIQPGDNVWIMGGTYKHPTRSNNAQGYTINLTGNDTSYITVRNYQQQRVTVDGGLNSANSSHLRVWGLEVIVSENLTQTRVSTQGGSSPTDLNRPTGGITVTGGHDVHFINNILHDNLGGFGFWSAVGGTGVPGHDSELYGNIVYDNGWIGPDRYHAHGIYTQNGSGSNKYITNNLLIDNYCLPIQAYGSTSAAVHNYVITGNLFRMRDGNGQSNSVFGGEGMSTNFVLTDNIFYKSNAEIGYSGGIDNVVLTDNTLIRGRVFNGNPSKTTNFTQTGTYAWNPGNPTPSQPMVFLTPNEYDPDLATLILFQWTGAANIQVDLSSFLSFGAPYQLLDPKNYFGLPVTTGIFNGGLVSIPMGGMEYKSYIVQMIPEPTSLLLILTSNGLWLLCRRGPMRSRINH